MTGADCTAFVNPIDRPRVGSAIELPFVTKGVLAYGRVTVAEDSMVPPGCVELRMNNHAIVRRYRSAWLMPSPPLAP